MVPKVSVIIPIYNVEEYLSQCLDSVINQTLKELEIILIDDGSTDSSLSICQEYAKNDKRIYVYSQQKKELGIIRNHGINLAKGEYIAFLDADDYWELTALEVLYKKAKTVNADIVLFNAKAFYDNTPEEKIMFTKFAKDYIPKGNVFSAQDLFDKGVNLVRSFCWLGIYKRSFVISKKCQFDEESCCTEDVIFSLKTILHASKIAYVNKFLIYYRLNRKNSQTSIRQEKWSSAFIAFKNIKKIFTEEGTYEKFGRIIRNKLLSTFYFQSIQIPMPVASFLENKFIKEVIPEFKLNQYDISYFYRESFYHFVQKLKMKSNFSDKLEHLFYSDRNKIIPVVFIVNEQNSWYTMVTIQSIIEHTCLDKFYDIYLLFTDSVLESTQNYFETLSHDNIRLTCIDLKSKLKDDSHFHEMAHHLGKNRHLFIIPELLYGYNKIIYLGNVLVKTDVAELANIPISDKPIAAPRAILTKDEKKYCKEKLGVDPQNYIDPSVVIFNIPEWQKQNLTQKVLEIIQENKTTEEMDVLNLVCRNNVNFLDRKWSYPVFSDFMPKNLYDLEEKSIQEKNYDSAKLLHYISGYKPQDSTNSRYARDWWSYARKSPFYEAILFQSQLYL